MIREFEQVLIENQFNHLNTNVPQLSVNYKIHSGKVFVLILFHLDYEYNSMEQFSDLSIHHIKRQIKESFYSQNFTEIEFMSILFVEDIEVVRRISLEDSFYWIADLKYKRLVIYENQPLDFMSVREQLEEFLVNYNKPNKPKNFSLINTLLVVVNVIVFIALEIGGDTKDAYYMLTRGAMFGPLMVENGEYYRLFTSMFLHFGVDHLSGNMISLLVLGDNLERVFGKIKYLTLYILSGLGASICSFAYNLIKGEIIVAAGASGAVFGVVGALFYVLIKNKGKLEDLTSMRLGILIIYILYSGFVSTGIDNAAHIGGLIIGFLLAIPMYSRKDRKVKRKEMESIV